MKIKLDYGHCFTEDEVSNLVHLLGRDDVTISELCGNDPNYVKVEIGLCAYHESEDTLFIDHPRSWN